MFTKIQQIVEELHILGMVGSRKFLNFLLSKSKSINQPN